MQITLNETEIDTALKNYLGQLISIKEGQNISIDYKSGRGENGPSAIIEIGNSAVKKESVTETLIKQDEPVKTVFSSFNTKHSLDDKNKPDLLVRPDNITLNENENENENESNPVDIFKGLND